MTDLRPNSEIADGIHWIKDSYVNLYIVERGNELILIDSGMNKKAKKIDKYVKQELEHRNISKVLITHAHLDHIGGLHHIHRHQHPNIYSSKIDGEVISGKRKGKLPGGILKPLFYITYPFMYPKPVTELQFVEDGAIVDEFKVHSFPGHTMGSLGFQMDNIMFSGDNAVSGKNNTITHAPSMFTEDKEENFRSLKKLANIDFDMLLSGHGTPIMEDASVLTHDLIERLGI